MAALEEMHVEAPAADPPVASVPRRPSLSASLRTSVTEQNKISLNPPPRKQGGESLFVYCHRF